MTISCPTRVVCKKTRENIRELRFLIQYANEIGIFSVCFRCRISDKEVIIRAASIHDYSTITPVSQIRTILGEKIQDFFHGWLLYSSRGSLSFTYYHVVLL